MKNTLSALHRLFFIDLFPSRLYLLFLFPTHPYQNRVISSFLSFSCSKRISLVIIYQLHKHKSSFSSFFALREEKLRSSLKKHGEAATLCVFHVTLMTAVLLPEEWRWWITATALLFWWMRAVLKVSLTFEVVTEWWTCAVESGRTICCLMLFWCVGVCYHSQTTQLFLLAPSLLASENQNREYHFNNCKVVLWRWLWWKVILTAEVGEDDYIKVHNTKK